MKVRVHDRTYKNFEERGSWCWNSSFEGLEVIRSWVFVPRYKNEPWQACEFR